jgi:hypothetical protein
MTAQVDNQKKKKKKPIINKKIKKIKPYAI